MDYKKAQTTVSLSIRLGSVEVECSLLARCMQGPSQQVWNDDSNFGWWPNQLALVAYSVPSGAPQSLESMFVQSTEVSLRWREVPCFQQNGPITGYVVMYYATHGADGDAQQNKSVVTTGNIIDGLTPNTEYGFQVAAVNVNGTGPLSEPITLGSISKVSKLWTACFMLIARMCTA